MCDNTSAISIAKNPVLYKRMNHLEVRHHFLRHHVEKRDIEMRYIDTEGQLADIFTKPLDASRFAALGEGGLMFAIPMSWFEGDFVFYHVYTLSYLHRIAFHSYQSSLSIASLIMLACIWLTMLIIMLG
jgi:hypothetical protein